MDVMQHVLIFYTIYFAITDCKFIPQREKRFILMSDSATNKASFQTPTPYPSPTIPNQKSTPGLLSGQAPYVTGVDLINSVVVKCPVKRSTGFHRVLLDERLMQDLYLTLIGDMDKSTVAGNYYDAEANFKHILASRTNKTHNHHRHHHHQNKYLKKSDFLSDLKKYHAWYNSIIKDIREDGHAHNDTSPETNYSNYAPDSLEAILSKIGISKTQLEQLLGLVSEIEDLKDFVPSNRRVRRDTIGAVKSRTEYCIQRGAPTRTGYLHMCSACALTTQFPETMFPRYVSEVTCSETDCDCFTVKNTPHGRCKPIVKTMRMLKRKDGGCRMLSKNGQPIIVDNWELYEQSLHVGCECMFKKNSMYARFIPKQ